MRGKHELTINDFGKNSCEIKYDILCKYNYVSFQRSSPVRYHSVSRY